MTNTGGIIILILGGLVLYYVAKKGIPNILNNKIISGTQNNIINKNIPDKIIISDNKITVEGNITPNVIAELKNIVPNLQGSQVTSLIHGGSIQTGYRGTNGKYYSSYEEAKRNGAA